MRTLKYFGTFLGGIICASLVFVFLIEPENNRIVFNSGFTSGVRRGHLEDVEAIQNEFGTYDERLGLQYKRLFGAFTSDVISIETNGVKTIRVIP